MDVEIAEEDLLGGRRTDARRGIGRRRGLPPPASSMIYELTAAGRELLPSVVELADDDDPTAKGVAVHHEKHETPAYAFALASLRRTKFPIPIGVFRAVEKPPYEALLSGQVAAARAKHGEGNLETLLDSGDTWTVEA